MRWFAKLTEQEQKHWSELVAEDLKNGGAIFGTTTAKSVKLDQWKEAFEEFKILATTGKIVISCE